jgi:hypothetical protein
MSKQIVKSWAKFRLGWYFLVLGFLGSLSWFSLNSCGNAAKQEAEQKRISDSITEAQKQDSIHQADSLALAAIEQARLDSIAKAKQDSVEKAKNQNQNNYKPRPTITKYGVPKDMYKD